MRLRTATQIKAATLSIALLIPALLWAQDSQNARHHPPQYKLIDMGTFGGPGSFGQDPSLPKPLNNRGILVGGAETTAADPNFPNVCLFCGSNIFHALQYRDGVRTDLGALPGANSSLANWVSDSGIVAGWSENGAIDPLLGLPEIEAAIWKHGQVIALGTLEGGYESVALAVNDRGEVAGVSSNLVPDPFGPLGTENRIFLWQDGSMRDIGTLGGPDAGFLGLNTGVAMNEAGQIVACSYTGATANPVTETPTLNPFLWEHGTMHDLHNLGGTSGCAMFVNNHGQVVGYSNLAGNLQFHPFLWEHGEMKDLGTFGGNNGFALWISEAGHVVGRADVTAICTACDNQLQLHHPFFWANGTLTDLGLLGNDTAGTAYSVNSKDQVVGISKQCTHINTDDGCDGPVQHAFLWEDGSLFDLQDLIADDSEITLSGATDINERGEIFASGVLPNGDGHLLLLIPCDGDHLGLEGCNDGMVEASAVASAQQELRQTSRPSTLPTRRQRTNQFHVHSLSLRNDSPSKKLQGAMQ
jgi:probable HAF family extracellular repeat protein